MGAFFLNRKHADIAKIRTVVDPAKKTVSMLDIKNTQLIRPNQK